jgi:hypothetical protein
MRKSAVVLILIALLVPVTFGFLATGSGSSFGYSSIGIRSSNKVYSPLGFAGNFFGGLGISGVSLSRPLFSPTYSSPISHVSIMSGFRWNFFDP